MTKLLVEISAKLFTTSLVTSDLSPFHDNINIIETVSRKLYFITAIY